jgi:hypothetical protein
LNYKTLVSLNYLTKWFHQSVKTQPNFFISSWTFFFHAMTSCIDVGFCVLCVHIVCTMHYVILHMYLMFNVYYSFSSGENKYYYIVMILEGYSPFQIQSFFWSITPICFSSLYISLNFEWTWTNLSWHKW